MITISLWYILLALIIFGFLIFIHEFGHFTMARLFGVTIKEFAIGMGPKIFTRVSKKNNTAYSLRLFPIGGFVAMEGEDEESDDENAFHKKAVWKRILITAAGAAMNIIVGVLVMTILVSTQKIFLSNTVGGFISDENRACSSRDAGLMIGDEIIKIDNVRVHIVNETFYQIMRRGIKPVDITVIRDGEAVTVENVKFDTMVKSGTTFGRVDFKVLTESKTLPAVLKHAWFQSTNTIKMIWESLYDLVTGRYGVDSISGPIGVTEALGEAAEQGGGDLVYLAVVISMNLGIMNLLPLPALDGGRLLFQLIEVVRGKPVKTEIEGYIHFAGLVILMILMAVIAVKDIIGLF